jgi:hypothetical protein
MSNRLFREDVPDELVMKFFSCIGLQSLDDFRWFYKTSLTPAVCEKFDEMLVELEPFYYPHKKFLVQRKMNENRYMQVLRQLARAKGYVLESKETRSKLCGKYNKTIMYRLKSTKISIPVEPIGDPFTVVFD